MSYENSSNADVSYSCPALLAAGHPDLYRKNAFRVSGLPVESEPREISKHLEKIRMIQKFSVTAVQRVPLGLTPPPDEMDLRNALHRLHDPERRLIDEFFWFWPHRLGHSGADEGLELLTKNDVNGAARHWLDMEQNSESLVSMHNLSVLYHCLALDIEFTATQRPLIPAEANVINEYWSQAFQRWKIVLEHEPFWTRLSARIRAIDDPRLTTGLARRMREYLPLALLSVNAELAAYYAEKKNDRAVQRQIDVMRLWDSAGNGRHVENQDPKRTAAAGSVNGVALKALERALEPVRQRIKMMCKNAETKTGAEAKHGFSAAHDLLEQAQPLLGLMDKLLPAGDVTKEAVFDEVAFSALHCQINYGNETDDWKRSLEILERTLLIAASPGAKDRIQGNINTVKNNLIYCVCWFCQEYPAQEASALDVKMYGDVARTSTWQGRGVTYRHGSVTVPRCEHCESAHHLFSLWQTAGLGVGTILGVIVFVVMNQNLGGFLAGSATLAMLYGFGYMIGKSKMPAGTRPSSNVEQFPSVQKLLRQGWSIGDKPST